MNAGSFAIFAAATLLASASVAGAQQRPPTPPPTPPPSAAPPPPGPAALSVPDPLAGFRPGPRDLYQSPDGSDRFQHLSRYPAQLPVYPPGIYFPGPYYYPSLYYHYIAETQAAYVRLYDAHVPRPHTVVARGGMTLQTVPGAAQVFVDGYYAGLAEEFGGQRLLEMDAGAHRIELRAPGYDTLAFSVMIAPGEIIRYRGDMQLLRPQAAAAAPAAVVAAPAPARATAKSVYVIPNCYAGDKPPSQTLPKGCDSKKLQTRK